MKYQTPCKYISRKILKVINADGKYRRWMKIYLSAKEFYLLKNTGLSKLNQNSMYQTIIDKLNENNIEANKKDIEFIIRNHNKLILLLKIIRSNIFSNNNQKERTLSFFCKTIFFSRILQSNDISITKFSNHLFENSGNNSFFFIAPVCPDYSYTKINEENYNYTFESVGSDIGLVAKKAIKTFQSVNNFNYSLCNFKVEFSILLGDFEANVDNLKALNETKESFINKLNGSVTKIKKTTNWESFLFCELCGGLDCWEAMITMLKKRLGLFKYDDLLVKYPHINHKKNLISRLSLYKKWYKNRNDFEDIFFNQCLEYILMGYLIELNYGRSVILLASDHRVMRQYYGLNSNLTIISSSANY